MYGAVPHPRMLHSTFQVLLSEVELLRIGGAGEAQVPGGDQAVLRHVLQVFVDDERAWVVTDGADVQRPSSMCTLYAEQLAVFLRVIRGDDLGVALQPLQHGAGIARQCLPCRRSGSTGRYAPPMQCGSRLRPAPRRGGRGDKAPGCRAAPCTHHDLAGHDALLKDAPFIRRNDGLEADGFLAQVWLMRFMARWTGCHLVDRDDQFQRRAVGPLAEAVAIHVLNVDLVEQGLGLLRLVGGSQVDPLLVDLLALGRLELGASGSARPGGACPGPGPQPH